MRRAAVAAALVVTLECAPALAADSAVVLMYHRFGEDDYPTTNIRLAEFEAHVRELSSGRYAVLPLIDILRAIRAGDPLPERTIAITIDDGYASVHAEAWPRLKAAKLPFTVFLSTAQIDAGAKGSMNWDHVRELAEDGVGIGAHTVSHLHMVEADEARNREELAKSNRRFQEELGKIPELFSYPYGEASARIMAMAKEAGYTFALGQHSGVAHTSMNDFFIPRFAVNEAYGDMARLKLILNALPVPVTDVTPADPLISGPNPPNLGFTVTVEGTRIAMMSCYASSEGRVRVEPLGERRIEVRFSRPLPEGRASRVNCTMPGPDGRWRWHGTAFYVPKS